jgi:hypothetical protein
VFQWAGREPNLCTWLGVVNRYALQANSVRRGLRFDAVKMVYDRGSRSPIILSHRVHNSRRMKSLPSYR